MDKSTAKYLANKFRNDKHWRDRLKGGHGDKLKPIDVDPYELMMGIRHEMEHSRDPHIAAEVALDHLSEDPKYYTKLRKKGIK